MWAFSPNTMIRTDKNARKTVWSKVVLWLGSMTALIALILIGEATADRASDRASESFLVNTADFLYPYLIGAPEPPANYVTVLLIDADSLTSVLTPTEMSSVLPGCRNRLFLSQLLDRLQAFGPSVIVLDMWFDPNLCPDAQEQSKQLWLTMDATSRKIPIVSGIGVYSLGDAVTERAADLAKARQRGAHLKPTEVVSKEKINLGPIGGGRITEGVVMGDADNRKIPLSWPVYDSFEMIGAPSEPRRIDSLSIAAARAFDPHHWVLERVGALDTVGAPVISTSSFPYTNFQQVENLPIIRAENVICATDSRTSFSPDCKSILAISSDLHAQLVGRIAFVGYVNAKDTHKSPIGEVAGVILQANYAESILKNRVYLRLGIFYQILVGVLWFGTLVAIPLVIERPQWIVFLVQVSAIVLSVFLLRSAISHFRIYPPFLLAMMLSGVILLATLKPEKVLDRSEKTE